MRKLSALIILLAIGVTLLTLYLNDYAGTPLSSDNNEVNLVIKPGMSFKQVSYELRKRGLIDDLWSWEILGRLSGSDGKIKAGEYLIPANLSPGQLLNRLIKGETIQFSITVIEGWTFNQLWETVKSHEKITHTIDTPEELLEKIEFKSNHPEGWFYPDTYFFTAGMTDVDFFKRAYEYMLVVLDEELQNWNEDLPLKTPEEVLTLASIIEKETSVEDERTLVASVFVSRLKRGMRLQTDPTVIYGMGETFDGNIKRADLKKDTPYNTYVHKGLPPTPIALPSRASIAAALNPDNKEVLYFVSKGDGTHHFSATYDEHREAVIKYQLNGNASKYKADNSN